MLVQNTIYKIIYNFFKIIFIILPLIMELWWIYGTRWRSGHQRFNREVCGEFTVGPTGWRDGHQCFKI